MASIIETFHIDWKIIIAQAINFGVVLAVLYFFALKPLNKLMRERSEKIERGVHDAKSNAELLLNTKAEYDRTLAKARAEAQVMWEEGKKKAEVKKAEMIESAKSEVETMIENGKKTLSAEKTKMVEDAKQEIVALALQATKKIFEKDADILQDLKKL